MGTEAGGAAQDFVVHCEFMAVHATLVEPTGATALTANNPSAETPSWSALSHSIGLTPRTDIDKRSLSTEKSALRHA
jgi:hypothetical protein